MQRLPRPDRIANSKKSTKGFTLVEVMVSLLILSIVAGAVFEQISKLQKRSNSEAMKLDQNQQAREFVAQTVHDLHMSGYPSASMYSNPSLFPSKVAAGLVSVSPTQIVMEGDVNNDGNVYSVQISYVASDPNDPTCPCIRRSAVQKIDADSFSQPTTLNYTETQYVLPPGVGTGQSGEDLFAYYDQNGNAISVPGGVDLRSAPATIASIKTVKINLSLLSKPDAESNALIRTSMSATSRLNQ